MTTKQQISRYSGAVEGDFEYTGTWSETHRHQCEVDEIARLPHLWNIDERIQGIRAKRGEEASLIIKRDVDLRRIELAKQGKLKTPSSGSPNRTSSKPSKSAGNSMDSLF
jgi:hypothetical protein